MEPTPQQQENKEFNEAKLNDFFVAVEEKNREEKIKTLGELKNQTEFDRQFLVDLKILPSLHKEIQEATQASDYNLIIIYLNFIAELAKTYYIRPLIGRAGILELLIPFFDVDNNDLQASALRVIANSAAEEEENVAIIHKLGVVEKCYKLVQENPVLGKNAAAVLSNLSQGDESIQKDLLSRGAMPTFLSKLDSSDPETLKMISFAVLSLLETTEGVEQFLELKGLEKILDLAHSENSTIRSLALNALEVLSREDPLKRPLYEHKCVEYLLNFVSTDAPIEQRQKAAQAIAHILTNDQNMTSLFDDGTMEGFKKWLEHEDLTIRAFSALCIGNIARTDDHCKKIVEQGLTPSLVKMLQNGDPKEKQGALAALRNLSLPNENKIKVGDSGILEAISTILDGDQLAFKYSVIMITKILITGNETNARKIVSMGFLEKIAEITGQTQHEGVQCESARVFVQIVLLNKSDLLESVLKADGVKIIKILMDSTHSILKPEALDALTILASISSCQKEIIESNSEQIIKILAEGSDDLKIKVLTLLTTINLPDTKSILINSQILPEITKLSSSSNEAITSKVSQLMQLS